MDGFYRTERFGIYKRVDNMQCVAGHARLFGLLVYQYNQVSEKFALHRVWNAYFFAIHHIGSGASTDPEGWHITRAKLKIKKIYKGFSIEWHWANTFRTRDVI